MATQLDKLITAVIRAIRSSGVLEENSRSATVASVNADGTLQVTRGDSTYPRVRRMSGHLAPSVGDQVTIHKTAGGWVCLGKLESSGAPMIQSGTFTQAAAATAGQWTDNVTVTFPQAFGSAPRVVVTPSGGGPGSGTTNDLQWQTTTVTSTSFQFRHLRGNTGQTATFSWIATTY